MKNHKLYNIWDQVPVTYYQAGVSGNLFQKTWHGLKIRLAKRTIREIGFENCLDVGCASGYMLSEIQKYMPQAKYFGVDIYDKAIKFARGKYPHINFQVASGDNLPFEDNSLDLIICYETLEHVEDPGASLKEIKRVLNKNGTLILAKDSGSWLFRLVWFFWENTEGRVWKGSHLHPFNYRQLDKVITESGLKIKDKYFSHLGMEVTYVLKK